MKLFGGLKNNRISRCDKRIPVDGKNGVNRTGADGEKSEAAAEDLMKRLSYLTPPEYELFRLLLEGYTLKESAQQLNFRYSAAKTHLTGIYRKLELQSQAELIIKYRNFQ